MSSVDWDDTDAVRVAHRNARLQNEAREAELNAAWREREAKFEAIRNRAPIPIAQATPSANASAESLAKALLADRDPAALMRRVKARAADAAKRRESAIAKAVADAAKPKDPRTTAEILAGYDRHEGQV